MEGDLRQPRADSRPVRGRRQRARVHHAQARLMVPTVWFVVAIVLVAFVFDFINGFHDSANSIATIVGTRVLSPFKAVLWAAAFNFLAAFTTGTAVAKAVGSGFIDIKLLTANLIFAALLGAIIWNLIT